MKTEFARSNKDNIATAAIVAVTLFAVASGLFNSRPAAANHEVEIAVQKMDTIVVSASRGPDAKLDTIYVTASRKNSRA